MSQAPKAYSYLRCSTPEQLRGDSFRRQSEGASRYARENGLILDDTLSFDDRGVSAFKGANREAGLGRFLDAVEAGVVAKGSYLLVESLDRLSRDKTRKALRALEDIVDAGIVVVTLSDRAVYSTKTLDENPVALFQALIVMMRAHEESSIKSSRMSRAWEAKRQRARMDRTAMTKRCPAWLRVEDGRYVEISDRADLVREIFKKAIEGQGKRAIVADFRKRGIMPWGRGTTWHESYVQKILHAEAAFGRFSPLKGKAAPIDAYFPTTVSEESYWSAQAARASRRTSKNPVPPGKASNLFSGIARCGDCGAGMHYIDKGARSSGPYLVCGNYRTGGSCGNGSKWLYHLMEREIIYFACLGGRQSFLPNQVARSAMKDEQIAARERHEAAKRRLDALTEAIAAGAGASLAMAHAAADLEFTKAKEALVAAETAARLLEPDDPYPNEMFALLWADDAPMNDAEWRRSTAGTLRRNLVRIEFRSDRTLAFVYPGEISNPAVVPFDERYCRMSAETHAHAAEVLAKRRAEVFPEWDLRGTTPRKFDWLSKFPEAANKADQGGGR